MANPLERDLESILLPAERIQQRVAELGRDIARDYQGKDLVLVAVLKGGAIFLSDLTRAVEMPHALEFMGAASYGASVVSSGNVRITKDLDSDPGGRHILLCEDIYDTGRTLKAVWDLIGRRNPASLKICSLLVKDRPRVEPMTIDYVGFNIPDEFVVGYGLDYNEHYRNLPMVGILKRERYAKKEKSDTA
jgi:hypoxanthine phosphoribosyltransferase